MTLKPAQVASVGAFVLSQVVTAAGIYAAIRADLREALVRVNIVERRVERLEDATAPPRAWVPARAPTPSAFP